MDFSIQEEWSCSLVPGAPKKPGRFTDTVTFFTNAEDFSSHNAATGQTYNFCDVATWFEVRLQVLLAAGWGPQCALADAVSVDRPPH